MLVVLLGVAPAVQAQSAGVFTRLGFGARGIGMSNALAADASGDTSPFYNPALAPFTARQNLEVSAALMTLDRELQFLQFSAPLRPRAGIAAGVIHGGVSNIDGRDNSGFHTEDYSTDEYAVFLAFGVRLSDRVTGGIGLQLFRADLFEDLQAVNTVGLDVGLSVRITDALNVGLVVDDLLARYAWDTSSLFDDGGRQTTDDFPVRLRLGAAYALFEGRARVTAEYESRTRSTQLRTRRVTLLGDTPSEVVDEEELTIQDSFLRIGAEYQLAEIFTVRGGVDQVGGDELGGLKPSAGFSVEQPVGELKVRAEYAFVVEPYAVDTMHLITLRLFL